MQAGMHGAHPTGRGGRRLTFRRAGRFALAVQGVGRGAGLHQQRLGGRQLALQLSHLGASRRQLRRQRLLILLAGCQGVLRAGRGRPETRVAGCARGRLCAHAHDSGWATQMRVVVRGWLGRTSAAAATGPVFFRQELSWVLQVVAVVWDVLSWVLQVVAVVWAVLSWACVVRSWVRHTAKGSTGGEPASTRRPLPCGAVSPAAVADQEGGQAGAFVLEGRACSSPKVEVRGRRRLFTCGGADGHAQHHCDDIRGRPAVLWLLHGGNKARVDCWTGSRSLSPQTRSE